MRSLGNVSSNRASTDTDVYGRLRAAVLEAFVRPSRKPLGELGRREAGRLDLGLVEPGDEFVGNTHRVADNARVDIGVLSQGQPVGVDVDDLRAVHQRSLGGGPLVQRGTERDDAVAQHDRVQGDRVREPAEEPEVVRLSSEQVASAQRRGHGSSDPARQAQQCGARIRAGGSLACQHYRTFCGSDEADCPVHNGWVGHHRLAGDQRRRRRRVLHLLPLELHRDVEHHGAAFQDGAADCSRQVFGDRLWSTDLFEPSPRRQHDVPVGDVLEVFAIHNGRVARKEQQRRVVPRALHECGHRVGQGRAVGDRGDAEPARGSGVAVCREDAARLVRKRDERASAMTLEGVHHVEVRVAQHAEHGADAVVRQRAGNCFVEEHAVPPHILFRVSEPPSSTATLTPAAVTAVITRATAATMG